MGPLRKITRVSLEEINELILICLWKRAGTRNIPNNPYKEQRWGENLTLFNLLMLAFTCVYIQVCASAHKKMVDPLGLHLSAIVCRYGRCWELKSSERAAGTLG